MWLELRDNNSDKKEEETWVSNGCVSILPASQFQTLTFHRGRQACSPEV